MELELAKKQGKLEPIQTAPKPTTHRSASVVKIAPRNENYSSTYEKQKIKSLIADKPKRTEHASKAEVPTANNELSPLNKKYNTKDAHYRAK